VRKFVRLLLGQSLWMPIGDGPMVSGVTSIAIQVIAGMQHMSRFHSLCTELCTEGFDLQQLWYHNGRGFARVSSSFYL
jgi:hypothetical protein